MQTQQTNHIVTTITKTMTTTAVMVVLLMMTMMGSGGGGGVGVMAATPTPSTRDPDLRRLWQRVTSHTETLRNINWYLKQTDRFWEWFQENQG